MEQICSTQSQTHCITMSFLFLNTPVIADFIILSLVKVMESTMLAKVKNTYKLPQMGKYKMLRAESLPKTIKWCDGAVDQALEMLG